MLIVFMKILNFWKSINLVFLVLLVKYSKMFIKFVLEVFKLSIIDNLFNSTPTIIQYNFEELKLQQSAVKLV